MLIETLAEPLRCITDFWPQPHFFAPPDADPETLIRRFIANLYPPFPDLLRAHQRYFETLFAEPARRAGATRWGLKEVRLSMDHALYLQWLFPRARFVFLIRNPYDAYRSYAARQALGWNWFRRWPDQPVTTTCFGRNWATLARSFAEGHSQVGGLLVRYEDLVAGRWAAIEDYLGFELSRTAAAVNPSDGGPPPVKDLPEAEWAALEAEVGGLAEELGYEPGPFPPSKRHPPGLSVSGTSGEREGWGPNAEPDRPTAGVLGSQSKGCVVLVAYHRWIMPECAESLARLEARGIPVRRARIEGSIDRTRNLLATEALRERFEELIWVGSDLAFDPEAVAGLRRHGLPLVCGLVPPLPGSPSEDGIPSPLGSARAEIGDGLIELEAAEPDFLLVHRNVFQAIRRRWSLPVCYGAGGNRLTPFFMPVSDAGPSGLEYGSGVITFFHRARECGDRLVADPTLRLRRVGIVPSSWEDWTAP